MRGKLGKSSSLDSPQQSRTPSTPSMLVGVRHRSRSRAQWPSARLVEMRAVLCGAVLAAALAGSEGCGFATFADLPGIQEICTPRMLSLSQPIHEARRDSPPEHTLQGHLQSTLLAGSLLAQAVAGWPRRTAQLASRYESHALFSRASDPFQVSWHCCHRHQAAQLTATRRCQSMHD